VIRTAAKKYITVSEQVHRMLKQAAVFSEVEIGDLASIILQSILDDKERLQEMIGRLKER